MSHKAPSTYYLKQRRARALIGLNAARTTLGFARLTVMSLDIDRFSQQVVLDVLTNELHKLEHEIKDIRR